MAPKELGSTEVYPQSIKHNSNGRFIVVCGNSEYIILQPRRFESGPRRMTPFLFMPNSPLGVSH